MAYSNEDARRQAIYQGDTRRQGGDPTAGLLLLGGLGAAVGAAVLMGKKGAGHLAEDLLSGAGHTEQKLLKMDTPDIPQIKLDFEGQDMLKQLRADDNAAKIEKLKQTNLNAVEANKPVNTQQDLIDSYVQQAKEPEPIPAPEPPAVKGDPNQYGYDIGPEPFNVKATQNYIEGDIVDKMGHRKLANKNNETLLNPDREGGIMSWNQDELDLLRQANISNSPGWNFAARVQKGEESLQDYVRSVERGREMDHAKTWKQINPELGESIEKKINDHYGYTDGIYDSKLNPLGGTGNHHYADQLRKPDPQFDERSYAHGVAVFGDVRGVNNLEGALKNVDKIKNNMGGFQMSVSDGTQPLGGLGVFVKGDVHAVGATDIATMPEHIIGGENGRRLVPEHVRNRMFHDRPGDYERYEKHVADQNTRFSNKSGQGGNDNMDNYTEAVMTPKEIEGMWYRQGSYTDKGREDILNYAKENNMPLYEIADQKEFKKSLVYEPPKPAATEAAKPHPLEGKTYLDDEGNWLKMENGKESIVKKAIADDATFFGYNPEKNTVQTRLYRGGHKDEDPDVSWWATDKSQAQGYADAVPNGEGKVFERTVELPLREFDAKSKTLKLAEMDDYEMNRGAIKTNKDHKDIAAAGFIRMNGQGVADNWFKYGESGSGMNGLTFMMGKNVLEGKTRTGLPRSEINPNVRTGRL